MARVKVLGVCRLPLDECLCEDVDGPFAAKW